jgi:3-demethoxyubiquinol 3-hydroxylase
MNERDRQIVARILKVNHAGEHGAIRIYTAQAFVAKWLIPDIVPKLHELRSHEIEHEKLFFDAMPMHVAKPCRLLFLWSWGGIFLGGLTALLGRRMVWICTEAVEAAVHDHLVDQLKFLRDRDSELHTLIASIQTEELSHLHYAQDNRGTVSGLSKAMLAIVGFITDALIAMSTSGDSIRLKRQLS